ncbi:cytochrome c oxidase accessory protein CcoG [Alkalilimnicola ehrlichii MLHE-1]|uniref:4Fe-4S ferredoxin, iron-sulfur binding domain protein n=1 Tax=Alkalilimnicola ehrlichii (strain ATCC BAA-1101 / DSM 17681 / MLHE-1) TaxID=187272 RepID=Q0A7G6_ALKEH|nr:cytochrome c oxidase accessory protein CcoG [Alkalilimnicola ehrlichii]ABI57221.1 4Fe-4S ferredoxin, iron-sulfur binding domain protein [Alkalilimnicola ehrlichii MLHE-1]
MANQPETGESLYQASEKIHPREIGGRFQRLRVLAVLALLGLYYVMPWVQWDGRQAILFDLPSRQFYIFGMVFWPQEFYFLSALLIIAAISLFFFTALAGRLWCGYACPQTVWTEVFLWMERWTEGPATKRKKLDKGPWTREKILRKTSKQAVWILFALFTGFTFVAYFSPATELASRLASFSLGPWETFWTLFYGFATYGNAGYMREQVCKYMCPYARFQGAMFDPDTLIISYDEERGEPRGPRKRGIDHRAKGLGDCIDCKLCVQVCPTGIDIRDGLQYECIACAACVDACDSVMDKMGYPRGLVRYSSERGMEGKRTKVLRPRIFLYGTLLTILAAVFVTALAMRSPVGLDVLPERNPMFRESGFGDIENIYTLKVINKDSEPRTFEVEVSGLTGAELSLRPETVSVRPGGVQDIIATVTVNMEHLEDRTSDVYFTITRTDDESVSTTTRTRFHGPAR